MMEFRETTLTTGVAVPVTATASVSSERAKSGAESYPEVTTQEREIESNEESTEQSEIVSKAHEKESRGVMENPQEAEMADKVLHSAKEEGFEEALTHLANGDFDDQDLLIQQESEESENEINETEVIDDEDGKEPSEHEFSTTETGFLAEQVTFLEQKVANLEEKNQQLAEKLNNQEARKQMSYQDFLEALMILKALADEEKDQKKKVDMLSAIVKFMENMMIMMFVPDGEKIVEERESKNEAHREEQDPTTDPEMWAKVFKIMEARKQHQSTEQHAQAA